MCCQTGVRRRGAGVPHGRCPEDYTEPITEGMRAVIQQHRRYNRYGKIPQCLCRWGRHVRAGGHQGTARRRP